MRVVYLVYLKFKDCYNINTSATYCYTYSYTYICIPADGCMFYSSPQTTRLAKTKADISKKSSYSYSSRCYNIWKPGPTASAASFLINLIVNM